MQALDYFDDLTPRSGAEQMALDEALLSSVSRPLLRHYTWSEPSATFGYGQSLAEVREVAPDLPLTRRWTGGGIVRHEGDWTFALIVPAGSEWSEMRPSVTYERLHVAIVEALREVGIEARLAESDNSGLSCFVSPVRHDILAPDGRKLCGGAQRRTRRGFLHQGSIQRVKLGADFGKTFTAKLALDVTSFEASSELLHEAESVAASRYGDDGWLQKTP
jgi:lipoate-protein ligase A